MTLQLEVISALSRNVTFVLSLLLRFNVSFWLSHILVYIEART